MSDLRALTDAILYEGYLLYPYRPDALKNQRHRFPFGTLYPAAFCERRDEGDVSRARTECVAEGPAETSLTVRVRFLDVSGGAGVAREASLPAWSVGEIAAAPRSIRTEIGPLSVELSASAAGSPETGWKIVAEVANATPLADADRAGRDEALARSLASAHLLLQAGADVLVSAIDPPDRLRALAESCRNDRLWPVLVGTPPKRDALLAAPIILYDYPQLAPESPGDFFDGTEIDELLTLRVLTLTEEEKREMAAADPRAKELLARTEEAGLPRLAALHGRFTRSGALRPGASVRLRPKGRADIFDLALAGKIATVDAVERDFEGRVYVAVTVDEDPGKDLGVHGHRFFFRPDEVEPL